MNRALRTLLGLAAAVTLAVTPAGARGAGTGVNDCGDGSGGHELTWSPTKVWPPNHKYHTVTIVYSDEAADHDLTLSVDGVSHDEFLEDGVTEMLGSGHTEDDWVVTDPGGSGKRSVDAAVDLRAERSGMGDGRTYTITYTARSEDSNGDEDNDCSGTVTISVPHDCRDHACIDFKPSKP